MSKLKNKKANKQKKGATAKRAQKQAVPWYKKRHFILTIGAIIVIAAVILTLGLTGVIKMPFNQSQDSQPSKDTPIVRTYSAPPPMTIDVNKKYEATIKTAKGDLVLELYAKDAPVTVNNFVFLAKNRYYNGLTFHRVMPGFMAQGGCPNGTGTGGPGYRFQDEFSQQKHVAGTLSMANSGADTNGSQFFICYAPQPHLDGKHSVFGQLTSGMDVLTRLVNGDRMIEVTITEK